MNTTTATKRRTTIRVYVDGYDMGAFTLGEARRYAARQEAKGRTVAFGR